MGIEREPLMGDTFGFRGGSDCRMLRESSVVEGRERPGDDTVRDIPAVVAGCDVARDIGRDGLKDEGEVDLRMAGGSDFCVRDAGRGPDLLTRELLDMRL